MFYSRFPLVFLPLLATVIYPRSGRSQAVDPIVIKVNYDARLLPLSCAYEISRDSKGSKFFYQNNGSQLSVHLSLDEDSRSLTRSHSVLSKG